MQFPIRMMTPAHRRYTFRTLGFMGGYAGVCMGAIFGALDNIESPVSAWALALVVSAPVIGQIWATLALMRESDEFVRAITAKQFILAAGVAMAMATVWGFGESFADAPHLPAWLVYPLFWVAFWVVAPFIRSSN